MANVILGKKEVFTITKIDEVNDEDEDVELKSGYSFDVDDISLPELAFSLSQFLKQLDNDETIAVNKDGGKYFLHLLQQNYYNSDDK